MEWDGEWGPYFRSTRGLKCPGLMIWEGGTDEASGVELVGPEESERV